MYIDTVEKSYTCNICYNSFIHKVTLSNHTRSNIGEYLTNAICVTKCFHMKIVQNIWKNSALVKTLEWQFIQKHLGLHRCQIWIVIQEPTRKKNHASGSYV